MTTSMIGTTKAGSTSLVHQASTATYGIESDANEAHTSRLTSRGTQPHRIANSSYRQAGLRSTTHRSDAHEPALLGRLTHDLHAHLQSGGSPVDEPAGEPLIGEHVPDRRAQDVTIRMIIDDKRAEAPTSESVGPPQGPLALLLRQGKLHAGDRLYWHRPRLGKRFVATVLASGELEIDGRRYQSPSDAASACANGAANGWTAWRRESDGTVLDKLRS
jgi:hypothetical protein